MPHSSSRFLGNLPRNSTARLNEDSLKLGQCGKLTFVGVSAAEPAQLIRGKADERCIHRWEPNMLADTNSSPLFCERARPMRWFAAVEFLRCTRRLLVSSISTRSNWRVAPDTVKHALTVFGFASAKIASGAYHRQKALADGSPNSYHRLQQAFAPRHGPRWESTAALRETG